MVLSRAARVPSVLLVFCQVKQERSYAYSTTLVSQEKIDNFVVLGNFCFTLLSLSGVFAARYSSYGFSVTRQLVWSTLYVLLFTCSFDVVRVKRYCISSVCTVYPGHSYYSD